MEESLPFFQKLTTQIYSIRMDIELPLVTIVINSYNQNAFLEKTILSVFEQDYPNMEVLLVDGGSTDGSLEIIQRYAGRFAWWLTEKDSGQAEGINKGLKRAKGELVAWLNSDDHYLPGAIKKAVACWNQNREAVMVYGDVIAVDENDRILNRMRIGDWQLKDLMEFKIINQPAVFMSRKALESSGYLDLDYHYLLDHQLWLKVASQGRMVHALEVWAAGRFHSAAKNVAGAANFGAEAYRMIEWMKLTQPYASIAQGKWNRVNAGAHRINARYLLDAGKPLESFGAYWDGMIAYPPAILPEIHRMAYSLLSMAGLSSLKRVFYAIRRLVRPVKMD